MSDTECLVCLDCGYLYFNDPPDRPVCPECHGIEYREATDEEEANLESDY